jgi:hypothetical protein
MVSGGFRFGCAVSVSGLVGLFDRRERIAVNESTSRDSGMVEGLFRRKPQPSAAAISSARPCLWRKSGTGKLPISLIAASLL